MAVSRSRSHGPGWVLFWLALSLTAAVAGTGAVHPNSAGAAGSTCGTKSNYLDGYGTTYQTSIYGVRADIERNDPALCSPSGGSPSLSAAWAMVTPNQAYHWAQTGYIKVGTVSPDFPNHTGFHTFAQYTQQCQPNCSGSGVTTAFGDDPGGTATYAAYLRSSDDRIHMTVDGTTLLTMNYDVTGEWVNDWAGQFAAETYHVQSDVPGTSSDRTRFNYIQRYESNGDINFIQNLYLFSGIPTRYKYDEFAASVGGRGIDLWTDRL